MCKREMEYQVFWWRKNNRLLWISERVSSTYYLEIWYQLGAAVPKSWCYSWALSATTDQSPSLSEQQALLYVLVQENTSPCIQIVVFFHRIHFATFFIALNSVLSIKIIKKNLKKVTTALKHVKPYQPSLKWSMDIKNDVKAIQMVQHMGCADLLT